MPNIYLKIKKFVLLKVVIFYSYVYGFFKDNFQLDIPFLGALLRLIDFDFVLTVKGRKIFFNHKVGVCYGRHFSNQWNEPETHLFVSKILAGNSSNFIFIDVGANVGEFVVDVSSYSNVIEIHAFEPIKECARAIRESCVLNGFDNVHIYNKLVGASSGTADFFQSGNISNSSIYADSTNTIAPSSIDVVALDDIFENSTHANSILLIDVEGFEANVIDGGNKFILRTWPVIIFEYNFVSKLHFSINDILSRLDSSWMIYRLRSDGFLDSKHDEAWNCVAFSRHSPNAALLSTLVLDV